MTWDDVKKVYHYPCPCGDRFEISKAQLGNYEDIATCPSCSLIIRVIYDPVSIYIFPLPRSSLIAHPISLITNNIPRTTKVIRRRGARRNFCPVYLSSVYACVGGQEKANSSPTSRLFLSVKTTHTRPRYNVVHIEDEHLATVQTSSFRGVLRLRGPLPVLLGLRGQCHG